MLFTDRCTNWHAHTYNFLTREIVKQMDSRSDVMRRSQCCTSIHFLLLLPKGGHISTWVGLFTSIGLSLYKSLSRYTYQQKKEEIKFDELKKRSILNEYKLSMIGKCQRSSTCLNQMKVIEEKERHEYQIVVSLTAYYVILSHSLRRCKSNT